MPNKGFRILANSLAVYKWFLARLASLNFNTLYILILMYYNCLHCNNVVLVICLPLALGLVLVCSLVLSKVRRLVPIGVYPICKTTRFMSALASKHCIIFLFTNLIHAFAWPLFQWL